ncbi:hypothetical protein CDAR_258031 [Caerostris darwini]|uniref:Transmembrane protein n=1 Tax=Caerostris darwini TaxID=1538125 RepID=A0AAV4WYA3_9ARAC|nr:hypothetical protein CDAR_258031 [Caerostris darwini]
MNRRKSKTVFARFFFASRVPLSRNRLLNHRGSRGLDPPAVPSRGCCGKTFVISPFRAGNSRELNFGTCGAWLEQGWRGGEDAPLPSFFFFHLVVSLILVLVLSNRMIQKSGSY